MRRSYHAVLLAALVAVLTGGCGATPAGSPSLDDGVSATASDTPTAMGAAAASEPTQNPGGSETSASGDSVGSDPRGLDASGQAGSPQPPPKTPPSPSPTASAAPSTSQRSDFPIDAWLDHRCVVRGGEVTITIEAGENTGVGYHAVYDGEEGGADPPAGEGHGGNGGDMTDADGRFQETWVVQPTAPVGPARVDVVAGRNGGFSTMVLRFEVTDPADGGCS